MREGSHYCPRCRAQVLTRQAGANHVLHLILTLFTCSAWSLVWIGCAIFGGPHRCTRCGSPLASSLGKKIVMASLFAAGLGMAATFLTLAGGTIGALLHSETPPPPVAKPSGPSAVAKPAEPPRPPRPAPVSDPVMGNDATAGIKPTAAKADAGPKPSAPVPSSPAQATAPAIPPEKTKSAPPAFDPAKRLTAAKSQLATSPEIAKKWLREIIDRYPASPEAAEAKKLLDQK